MSKEIKPIREQIEEMAGIDQQEETEVESIPTLREIINSPTSFSRFEKYASAKGNEDIVAELLKYKASESGSSQERSSYLHLLADDEALDKLHQSFVEFDKNRENAGELLESDEIWQILRQDKDIAISERRIGRDATVNAIKAYIESLGLSGKEEDLEKAEKFVKNIFGTSEALNALNEAQARLDITSREYGIESSEIDRLFAEERGSYWGKRIEEFAEEEITKGGVINKFRLNLAKKGRLNWLNQRGQELLADSIKVKKDLKNNFGDINRNLRMVKKNKEKIHKLLKLDSNEEFDSFLKNQLVGKESVIEGEGKTSIKEIAKNIDKIIAGDVADGDFRQMIGLELPEGADPRGWGSGDILGQYLSGESNQDVIRKNLHDSLRKQNISGGLLDLLFEFLFGLLEEKR